MKKVKTQIKSRVATKNKISTGHKIALSMLVFSAFFVGLNFAGLAFSIENNLPLGLDRGRFVRAPKPLPLSIDNLQTATANITIVSPDGAGVDFFRGDSRLGTLDLNSNSFIFGYDTINNEPLKLSLTHMEQGIKVFPARIINIEYYTTSTATGVGDWGMNEIVNLNLCLPESQVFAGELNYPVSYYYDVNGTPYYDKKLTQMATPKPCNQLLANALDIEQISQASANLAVQNTSDNMVNMEINFQENFAGPMNSLGILNLADNRFYNNYYLPTSGKAPLAIELQHMSDSPETMPARTVYISDGIDNSKTLCVPETVVPDNFYPGEGDIVLYFYDNNGTPYHDSLLTQMATPKPCNQLLANALDVDYISSANIAKNNLVESPDMAEITFVINGGARGTLHLNDNTFSGDMPPGWGMNDLFSNPLAIILGHGEEGTQIIPTRDIIVESDGVSHNLCVPASKVGDWQSNDVTYYFYDKNGKPYRDSLLTHSIACRPVNIRYDVQESLPQ